MTIVMIDNDDVNDVDDYNVDVDDDGDDDDDDNNNNGDEQQQQHSNPTKPDYD